jgi:hypothetical protein
MQQHQHVYDLAGQMLANTTAGTAPQQAPVTQTPGLGTSAAGAGGAVLVAVAIIFWLAGSWKKAPKPQKTWAILGFVVASLLVGAGGLAGMIQVSIKQTGQQVGTSVTQTGVGNGPATVTSP